MHEIPHLLILSPLFVPQADSEAFCGAKFTLALQEIGVRTTVFAAGSKVLPRKRDESRCWNALASSTRALVPGPSRTRLGSLLAMCRYRVFGWSRWIDEAVKAARDLHKVEPISAVVSRTHPWFAAAAGYWISRALRLPWIANMNDPWDYPAGAARGILGRFETGHRDQWLRRTLQTADLVTYPCARLGAYFESVSGVRHSKAVFPHIGWMGDRTEKRTGEFAVVHAGKLGMNETTGRNTLALLRGIRSLMEAHPEAADACRLVLVGPEDPLTTQAAKELGLEKQVISIGRVSYEESLNHIAKADVCVLVEGNFKEGIFLPSKFADYVVGGKPVLALSPRTGTIADIPETCGVFRADPDDGAAVGAHLERLFRAHQQEKLASLAPPESFRQTYGSGQVAASFARQLRSMKILASASVPA